jgi:peptidyl-prolyl cis-trans isomerase SurA
VRKLFLPLILALMASPPSSAATVDRIAAVVDRQVLTVSEVNQLAEIRFFARTPGRSDDEYRHDILDALIAQTLRFRDVERFGVGEIPKESIEARLQEIMKRFPSQADFDKAMKRTELTPDEVRALIKRQLQVEAYIEERFSPLIFISNDEIDTYYQGPYSKQRREHGQAIPPVGEVREEIRARLKSSRLDTEIEKWTGQLRERANVDVYAWK